MARFTGLLLAIFVLAGISLLTSGCGNGTPPSRTLQSISVNPTSADAQLMVQSRRFSIRSFILHREMPPFGPQECSGP